MIGKPSEKLLNILFNQRTGVRLTIGRLPSRKSLCFYFTEGNAIYPVAYIKTSVLDDAERLWDKLLEGIPEKLIDG